jgi:putrescine transport system ATP-binding protein
VSEDAAKALHVQNVNVTLGGQPILREVSFRVDAHTTMAVIGPSGCGKTTLLRTIAGLVARQSGRILLGVEPVEAGAAGRLRIVHMSQEALLFPHLDVLENIAFGLRVRHVAEPKIRRRVAGLIEQLALDGLELRRPDALSGGQRQRVAFGRALAADPALLLLDEPFSNLDPDTRAQMQDLFKRLAHAHGTTALFVTHDLKESIRIGDSFAMFRAGRLKTYPDRERFCADPLSGVDREAAFWRGLPGGGR